MASANSGSLSSPPPPPPLRPSSSSSLSPWCAIFYLLDCLTCRAAAAPPQAASARSRSLLFLFGVSTDDAAAVAVAAANLLYRSRLGRPIGRPLLHGRRVAATATAGRVRKSVGASERAIERERAVSEALDQSTAISVMEENGVRKTGDCFGDLTESSV